MRSPECPDCTERLVPRYGPRGHFWGCPDYPDCTGTENLYPPDCPKCDAGMVPREVKNGPRRGEWFFGCKAWSTTGCKGIIDLDC